MNVIKKYFSVQNVKIKTLRTFIEANSRTTLAILKRINQTRKHSISLMKTVVFEMHSMFTFKVTERSTLKNVPNYLQHFEFILLI